MASVSAPDRQLNRNRCAATGLLRTLPAGISKSFRRTPDNKKPRKAGRRPGFGIPARKVASRGPPEPVFSSGPHQIHRERAKMRCQHWLADNGCEVEVALVSIHGGRVIGGKTGKSSLFGKFQRQSGIIALGREPMNAELIRARRFARPSPAECQLFFLAFQSEIRPNRYKPSNFPS
jgi:hypothetical protein